MLTIPKVYRGARSPFLMAYKEHLKVTGSSVDMVTLEDIENIRYDRFLFVVELERPLFLDIFSAEWDGLQTCLKCARSALWVTIGSLMRGMEPLFAMVSDIPRGLKTEVQQLRVSVLDLDRLLEPCGFALQSQFEQRIADPSKKDNDTDFRIKDGITYISRLMADDTLND